MPGNENGRKQVRLSRAAARLMAEMESGSGQESEATEPAVGAGSAGEETRAAVTGQQQAAEAATAGSANPPWIRGLARPSRRSRVTPQPGALRKVPRTESFMLPGTASGGDEESSAVQDEATGVGAGVGVGRITTGGTYLDEVTGLSREEVGDDIEQGIVAPELELYTAKQPSNLKNFPGTALMMTAALSSNAVTRILGSNPATRLISDLVNTVGVFYLNYRVHQSNVEIDRHLLVSEEETMGTLRTKVKELYESQWEGMTLEEREEFSPNAIPVLGIVNRTAMAQHSAWVRVASVIVNLIHLTIAITAFSSETSTREQESPNPAIPILAVVSALIAGFANVEWRTVEKRHQEVETELFNLSQALQRRGGSDAADSTQASSAASGGSYGGGGLVGSHVRRAQRSSPGSSGSESLEGSPPADDGSGVSRSPSGSTS